MRKYLVSLIFVFILSFIFIENISAKNYKYSCDYRGTDNNEYVVTFEVIGDKISILSATKSGRLFAIDMKNEFWTKDGDCPGVLSLHKYADKESQTSATDAMYYAVPNNDSNAEVRLKHYYTLNCKYSFGEDEYFNLVTNTGTAKLTGINVRYENSGFDDKTYIAKIDDKEQVVIEIDKFLWFETGRGEPKKRTYSYVFGSIENEFSDKCINIDIEKTSDTENNFKVIFNANGKYKGKLYGSKIDYHKQLLGEDQDSDGESDTNITGNSNCLEFSTESTCRTDEDVSCVWVEDDNAAGDEGGYCNVDNLQFVGCGGASDIPVQVPSLISLLVNLLKIATPIILIFVSIISLVKAMSAGKEDEIKKATNSLVRKLISAALVFFVIAIVQFVVSKVAEDEDYQGFTDCLTCFLNNECNQATYYKTVISGVDYCTRLTDGPEKTEKCEVFFK